MVPWRLTIGMFATAWWYVVIYNAPSAAVGGAGALATRPVPHDSDSCDRREKAEELRQAAEHCKSSVGAEELSSAETTTKPSESAPLAAPPQEMGSLAEPPRRTG